MKLIGSVAELRELRRYVGLPGFLAGGSIGLVPTMGALHQGHESLIRRCRQECELTVVSIFVNPLQFGPGEDLSRYPRTLDQDCQRCEHLGVDWVFAPESLDPRSAQEAQSGSLIRVIPPLELLRPLCGSFRPGHFEGVLTVVAQLLHIVQPQRAYFGQKDFQQLVLIQRMVQDLWVDTTIVGCSTIRDPDGLALSSRNRYLSPEERQQALGLNRALSAAQDTLIEANLRAEDPSAEAVLAVAGQVLAQHPGLRIQYLELVNPETLQPVERVGYCALLAVAAHVGQTRLIDNLLLEAHARH